MTDADVYHLYFSVSRILLVEMEMLWTLLVPLDLGLGLNIKRNQKMSSMDATLLYSLMVKLSVLTAA